MVPGLIGQHDHPFLTALMMVTEIIAIEDWSSPAGVVQAANNRAETKVSEPVRKLLAAGDIELIDETRHRTAKEVRLPCP